MAWFLPPASPTVSGLASPHPTSQIKTFNIIAPHPLMATQHTSFIQPPFLISHYQIPLNSIQPFRIARTAREVLLTPCEILRLFVCACVRVPGAEWILTQGQSLFLGEADFHPGVGLASSLSDKPFTWRAPEGSHSVHQHKQVTSSHNSTPWLYSISTKVVEIVMCYRLFGDEQPGWVKWGPGVHSWGLRKLTEVRTICNLSFSMAGPEQIPGTLHKRCMNVKR